MIAAMRAVTEKPLDVYVEVPDDMGGFIRSYLVPDIVRVAAPVHVKLGLRNATSVYPSGLHLEAVAAVQAREKVRRAALVQRLIQRADSRARRVEPFSSGHARRQTTVDDERLRGAERRLLRAQEEGHRGDLLRATDAPERVQPASLHARRRRVGLDLEIALCHAGVDVTRTDTVAADAILAKVERDRAREVDHRTFGRAVGAELGLDPEAVDRGHVDDRAATQAAHARDRCPGAQVDALEVDPEDAVPILGRRVLDRAFVLDRGVGDQRVGSAVLLGGRHQPLNVIRIGDVAVMGLRLPARALHRRERLVQGSAVNVGAERVRTRRGETFGNRPTDPLTAPVTTAVFPSICTGTGLLGGHHLPKAEVQIYLRLYRSRTRLR